ncbi:exported hypothetical protein [Paraburkholderia ribeironis]|uniref:Uncharacterized protein n=1 Tax=Paraburkholderia ribeironis TaxID=1247936 RepID=A0A1N7RKF6_9BURK|nr:hypothetical protein [Paraburkholderia ribeironis]SIT35579.1 exported hypothetical protein [Paraburkholderia ribeironis]
MSGETKWVLALRRIRDEKPRIRLWSGRRIFAVALAGIVLSVLFAWSFLNLLLVLVFPGRSAIH